MTNLLKNPGFEGNWWRKTHTGQEFGEIFVPEDWVAFWKQGGPVPHDPGNPIGYGRPEMHVINREPPFLDPLRIQDGNRGLKLFTFYRIHDAGVYQRVEGITPGTWLRGTGFAHAWSSGQDNPRVSDGVGEGPFFVRASDYDKVDNVRNFTFTIGIDPTGGTDPWASTVVWGEGAHIYNAHAQVPPVEVVAQGTAVTFFARSAVLWPFKHCDAYMDEMELVVVDGGVLPPEEPPVVEPEEPLIPLTVAIIPEMPVQGEPFEITASGGPSPDKMVIQFTGGEVFQGTMTSTAIKTTWRNVIAMPGTYTAQISTTRGQVLHAMSFEVQERPVSGAVSHDFVPPREPYARTYVLLPPGAGDLWLRAALDSGVWSKYHWTIGGSADDAGVGPRARKVIAVNPQGWPGDLKAFFNQYYPGVDYVAIVANTPEDLRRVLSNM